MLVCWTRVCSVYMEAESSGQLSRLVNPLLEVLWCAGELFGATVVSALTGLAGLFCSCTPSLILYCQACNVSLHPFQLPRDRGLLRHDEFKIKLRNEHPLGIQNSASQMLFSVLRVYEMCWVTMPWWKGSTTWWLGYCVCLYFIISFHSSTPKDKIWDFSVCSLCLGAQRRLPGSLCFLAEAVITVCSICTAWQG